MVHGHSFHHGKTSARALYSQEKSVEAWRTGQLNVRATDKTRNRSSGVVISWEETMGGCKLTVKGQAASCHEFVCLFFLVELICVLS